LDGKKFSGGENNTASSITMASMMESGLRTPPGEQSSMLFVHSYFVNYAFER